MEKILNKYIKDIEIKENCLEKLNEKIEKYYINSRVLFIVDFLSYQNNYAMFKQIKNCSLNNVTVKVLYSKEKCEKEIYNLLNETFSLIVGIGDFFTLMFVKNFAIKNNINFALCNLFDLKCEIITNFLCDFNANSSIEPTFILINKNFYLENKQEIFYCLTNIFKYSYIMLSENDLLKADYLFLASNVNEDNILEKVVAMGLLLKKYNIHFFLKDNYNDFLNYIYSNIYMLIIKNIIKKISTKNLYKIELQDIVNFTELKNYKNFDETYFKNYLLLNKNYLLDLVNNIILLNKRTNCYLKKRHFSQFYSNLKKQNLISLKNIKFNDFKDEFLTRLQYFEIFYNTKKLFA